MSVLCLIREGKNVHLEGMERANCKNVLRSILEDSVKYIPSQIFPAIFGFLSLSIYTRVFSPIEYGKYMLITATVDIIGTLVYSWLNQANLRFFSYCKKENKLEIFSSTSFFSLIVMLGISSIVLFIISKYPIFPQSIKGYLKFIVCLLFSTGLFETLMTILRADRNPKAISLLRSMSSALYLIISLLLVFYLKIGISSILVGYIVTNFILSFAICHKYKKVLIINISSFSKKVSKQFADYGVPLVISGLFAWILSLSDRYMIEYFRGASEVGIYAATCQLASYPLSLISSMIIMAGYPVIIEAWEENKGNEIVRELISNIIRYYIIIAIPLIVGIISLSSEFALFLGDAYSSGTNIIPWICIGSLASGLCIYINKGLELKKKTRILSWLVFIAGLCNIFINLLLIPKYGYYGAAISTCLSYIIYFLLSVYISYKNFRINIHFNTVRNTIFSAIGMQIILYIIKEYFEPSMFSLFLLILIGILIYFVLLSLTKEIHQESNYIREYMKLCRKIKLKREG